MCGIVGAVSQRNVEKILLEGLKRLEYRGYDSAGMALVHNQKFLINKAVGKVSALAELVQQSNISGKTGIAHTRWATHGIPSQNNAHPHTSENISIVHNGIIENYKELRSELIELGYVFLSETDTEAVVHLFHYHYKQTHDLMLSLQQTIKKLQGAYGLVVMCENEPDTILGTRSGSPLVVGIGIDENFLASDQLALRQVTDRFIYLEEGDVVKLRSNSIDIFDQSFSPVVREEVVISDVHDAADKDGFRHYMLKEIFEQPEAIARTLDGRISHESVVQDLLGEEARTVLSQVTQVQIVACGTSYHAGLIAKYAIEEWAGIPCLVDIASEYRYRKVIVPDNALFISISQSGETADTLAALRKAKASGYLSSLAICNVPNSSLVRESAFSLMTCAGVEIGVASTKAFTTQIVALQLVALMLAEKRKEEHKSIVQALHQLPDYCQRVLELNDRIEKISEHFVEKHHALFLGRGVQYPVAMEGALKLKEISYIHAEAYAAGELKHGPLALVDSDMPVITVAPNNELLEKLKSNLEEVQARGGKLYVFADQSAGFSEDANTQVFNLPHVPACIAPIIYTLPLQLLSYHVAVMRGTDVDQPRNLAKSVTVE
ncbi:Glutamine--fructose-6-phosphate aminotransferase [isomerizing] [Thalassocella blandensis]|nr:Glutamine--fructose-6-phosphate aminotransferase [isomerizing] [Thalassocella blandensis]